MLALAGAFAVFDTSARLLGSDRGQAGVLVGVLVVGALLAAEQLLLGEPMAGGLHRLGFGVPRGRAVGTALIVGALLLAVVPLYRSATGATFEMYPGWAGLLPGLFAQAGLAEESLFRGFLFRRLREGRTFWHAALVASGPFVLVHLWLFVTLPWPIAAASVLLAVAISFPFAHLFELGGNTVWAPALVHWVVQGTVKVLVWDDDGPGFAMTWMAASAVVPYVAFVTRRRHHQA